MIKPMTVSIVLATYNGARFLREQLASLAAQDHRPFELIVTDDGSTDDTLVIAAEFAETSPFSVRIFKNAPRLGFRGNFMRGASLCSGDLIAFCDQDDVWLPSKLRVQVADFADPHVLASCHNAALIDADGTQLGRDLRQFSSTELTFHNTSPFSFPRGFTQVVRRELLSFEPYHLKSKDIGDPSEPMSHDQWFFFLSVVLGKVRYHDTALALYRQHESNWSGAVETRSREIMRRLADRRHEYERLPVIWKSRAELISAMLSNQNEFGLLTEKDRLNMKTVRARYIRLHDATRRRQSIYQADTWLAKIGLLTRSLLQGDYRPHSFWHFSFRGAIRDLFVRPHGTVERKR